MTDPQKPLYDWRSLEAQIRDLPGAVIAFSGGVDSATLVAAAVSILGRERVLAVIADSASLARTELQEAREVADFLNVELRELKTQEMSNAEYRANSGDRCFWCKEALFNLAKPLAEQRGWALLYGENADDVGEHRPGAKSASRRGVLAPLREAGWTKAMVRAYARKIKLTVADKPAMPCLASRVPVGVQVNLNALQQIESLERSLKERGYGVVRARHYSASAVRLEFGPDDLQRALRDKNEIRGLAEAAGYEQADIDPRGYQRGGVAV